MSCSRIYLECSGEKKVTPPSSPSLEEDAEENVLFQIEAAEAVEMFEFRARKSVSKKTKLILTVLIYFGIITFFFLADKSNLFQATERHEQKASGIHNI